MFNYIILILGMMHSIQSQVSPSCSRDLQNILNQIQNTSALVQMIAPYVALSGKGNAQYGDYDACKSRYQYGVLSAMVAQLGSINVGACFTKNCSITELNQNIDVVKQYIVDNHLADNLPFNLSTTPVSIIDTNAVLPNPGFGAYFTVSFIIALFAFSLVIPIVEAKRKLYQSRSEYGSIQSLHPGQINNSLMAENAQTIHSEETNLNRNTASQISDNYVVDLAFFRHFSFSHNWKEFTTFKNPDPNLTIFNGFRALSFMMVVFGHVYITLLFTNFTSVPAMQQESMVILAVDCFFSVDSFFWIGGFFLGFVMADQKKISQLKKQGILAIPMALVHRLLRLLPAYIVTIMIVGNIAPLVGDGPKWSQALPSFNDCNTYWWENLLFIKIYKSNSQCLGQSWYLDNDVQIFMSGVIIMYFYCQFKPWVGKVLIIAALVSTQIAGLIYSINDNLKIPYIALLSQPDMMQTYYIKPWYRSPPYYLGLLIGVLYREYKAQKQQDQQNRTLFGKIESFARGSKIGFWMFFFGSYILGAFIILWLSFSWEKVRTEGPNFWPDLTQNLYFAFARVLYTFGMTLITLPNMLGFQDRFNTSIMNNGYFGYLAKLSYTGFLIHFTLIDIIIISFYEGQVYSDMDLIIYFIGIFAVTLFFSMWLTLLVEMPFANLVNHLLNGQVSQKNPTSAQGYQKLQNA